LFSAFPQGLTIGEIVFRIDGLFGRGLETTLAGVEINLSTTSRSPDALSSLFDQNVGGDDRRVVGPGPIHLSAFPGLLPNGWAVGFDFTANPFVYNPAAGNLLLDIKVFNGANTSPFDAVDVAGDSVSSVFAYGNPMPTSGQPSSLGLATLFAVQAVPEPGTVSLLLLGLGMIWFACPKGIPRQTKSDVAP